MARMWGLWIEFLGCCVVLASSQPVELDLLDEYYTYQDEYYTYQDEYYTYQDGTVSCTDIHVDAFGNETVKPGVCYLLSDEEGVFLDAKAFCQGLGDNLGWDVADIEDAEENNLIHDKIAAMKASGSLGLRSRFWIGQNDMKKDNVWRYLNDSSNKCNRTVYLNWADNEPNGGLRENCVVIYCMDAARGFWEKCCDFNFQFFCKVKLTPVPSCPGFIEDTSTEAPDECLEVLPTAFSNPSVPGVCYASDNYNIVPFVEALRFCELLPGGSWSIADIEDADENLFLEAWNKDNFPHNNGYWIGQNDREQDGDYRYTSSGQCPVYLNWLTDEPNGARQQNCLAMFKREWKGGFRDIDCGERAYYTLCKLKKDSGPRQDALTSCDGNTLPPEVAACSNLHPDAFGSVDNPGVCYLMTGLELTWNLAVDFCQGQGWSLIDIEDTTENDILAARHRDFGHLDIGYWVGQNDREIEGSWKYYSNDAPSDEGVFLNWASGNPDGGSAENCVMMEASGLWVDRVCSEYYLTTCKKRIGQATTTAAPAPCTDPSLITRPRQFLFLTSDATCRPNSTLTPSTHATNHVQCARNCLLRDNCWSFGFTVSGKEDACQLCTQVLDVKDLKFKPGSRYYYKSC